MVATVMMKTTIAVNQDYRRQTLPKPNRLGFKKNTHKKKEIKSKVVFIRIDKKNKPVISITSFIRYFVQYHFDLFIVVLFVTCVLYLCLLKTGAHCFFLL